MNKGCIKGINSNSKEFYIVTKKILAFLENGKQQLKMFWWTSLFSLTCLCLSVRLHSILHYNQCCYTIETIPTYRLGVSSTDLFPGSKCRESTQCTRTKSNQEAYVFNPPHSPDEGSMQLWRRWLEEWWITLLGSSYPWQDCQTVTFMTFSNFTTPCIVYYKDSMII